jgi:NADH dehydrogenase
MRVEETLPRRVTFATVQGHPVAGVVRFMSEARAGVVRFVVEVYARSGSAVDFVALKAGGAVLQDLTWTTVCKRMLERSGGTSDKGVEHFFEHLEKGDAHDAEAWIERVIVRRERDEHAALVG